MTSWVTHGYVLHVPSFETVCTTSQDHINEVLTDSEDRALYLLSFVLKGDGRAGHLGMTVEGEPTRVT